MTALFSIRDDPTPKVMGGAVAYTVSARDYKGALCVMTKVIENHSNDSRMKIKEDGVFQTLSGQMGTGGNNTPMVIEGDKNAETRNQVLRILQETYGEKEIIEWGIAVLDSLQQTEVLQQGMYESSVQSETENGEKLDDNSLPCPTVIAEWILRNMREQSERGRTPQGWEPAKQRYIELTKIVQKLPPQSAQASEKLFGMWEKGEGIWLLRETLSEIQEIWKSLDDQNKPAYGGYIVRRLTPLEAERLQGFPDGWTDIGEWTDSKGKRHKPADGPRYKALGNSIALPFWEWMAERMVKHIKGHKPTMASLFDGIGGFPLVYSRCGCEPVWASEIEEFPIAVTKKHFPDTEETGGEDGILQDPS